MARNLIPIFVGTTGEGKTIAIYQHRRRKEELHVQIEDGELIKLTDAEITMLQDLVEAKMHITIKSTEWTGRASATRVDLIEMRSK